MKHIKHYETINVSTPQVGDYVICTSKNFEGSRLQPLIKDHIGKLINIEQVKNNADLYYILYDSIEGDIQFWKEEILHYSKNKEDLETILTAQKYNL